LPVSLYSNLEGVRCVGGDFIVRDGHYQLTAAVPIQNASFRGATSCTLNGTAHIYAAFRVNSETRIYELDVSAYTWAEITESSGAYGQTRFPTDAWVSYAVIRSPWADMTDPNPALWEWGDALLFCNGTDSVRSYNPTGGAGLKCAVIEDIPTPGTETLRAPQLAGRGTISYSDPAVVGYTITNSRSPGFVASWNGGAGGNLPYYQFDLTAAATAGDTVLLDLGVTEVQVAGKQFWLYAYDPSATSWLDHVKVELYTATASGGTYGYTTIWDPADSASEVVSEAGLITNWTLHAFPIDDVPIDSALGYFFWNRIRFTWVGAAIGVTSFFIYRMESSGNIQGGVAAAHTRAVLASGQESPPVYLPTAVGYRLGTYGTNTISYPVASTLWYSVGWQWLRPSVADMQKGIGLGPMYMKLYGGTEWYAATPPVGGTYTAGAWVTTGAGTYTTIWQYTEDINTSIPVPPSDLQAVGPASCLLATNNRLYAGVGSELWISQDTFPMRMAPTVAFDTNGAVASSGTVNRFSGELCKALVPTPTTWNNLASVVCITDKAVYLLVGTDATSLSRPSIVALIGTIYPKSVAPFKGEIWFIDSDGDVRVIREGAGLINVSKRKVDDKLRLGTLTDSTAFTTRESYVVSYKKTGDSVYYRTLHFDMMNDEWVGDRMGEGDCAGFLRHSGMILAFTNAGHVYQWEKPGQTLDGVTAIPVSILTGQMHADLWTEIQWGAVGVVSSDATASFAVTQTFLPDGSTVTSSLSLEAGTKTEAYVWAQTALGGRPGGEGYSMQVLLTGANIPGGETIRAIAAEVLRSMGEGAE